MSCVEEEENCHGRTIIIKNQKKGGEKPLKSDMSSWLGSNR